jgi:hypothetical protein
MIIKDNRTKQEIDTGNRNPRIGRLIKRVNAFIAATVKLVEDFECDVKAITLTYKRADDWEPNHIRDFLRELRRNPKLTDNIFAYAWVAELQKRGAVHYHLFLIVKQDTWIPKPDESGMWVYGMSKIENGISIYYLSSFSQKKDQKDGWYPEGLRTFAVWIKKGAIPEYDYWLYRLSSQPKWLSDEILALGKLYFGQIPRRKNGGGYEMLHPSSSPSIEKWIPFYSPYTIVSFTSPEINSYDLEI